MLCCPCRAHKCVSASPIFFNDVGQYPALVAIRTDSLNCLEKIRAQFGSEILFVHRNQHLRFVTIRRDPSDQPCGVLELVRVEGRLRKKLLQINAFRSIAVNQSNLRHYRLRTALPEYSRDTGFGSNRTITNYPRQKALQPCASLGVQRFRGPTYRVGLREIPCCICLDVIRAPGKPASFLHTEMAPRGK